MSVQTLHGILGFLSQAFEKDGLWQLHKVDYIDGVSDLYVSKGSALDILKGLGSWGKDEKKRHRLQ